MNLTQGMKVCTGIEPTRDPSGGLNGEGINLANAHTAYIIAELDQSGADQITVAVQQSEGTNWEAMTNTLPIWVCLDTDADDVLVGQTNAVNYQTTAAAAAKLVIIQVDPAKLDAENGTSGDPNYAIRARITGGAAGDTVSALYLVTPTRYKEASVPEIRL